METLTVASPARANPSPHQASRYPAPAGTARGAARGAGPRAVPNAARGPRPERAGGGVAPPAPPPRPRRCCLFTAEAGDSREIRVGAVTSM